VTFVRSVFAFAILMLLLGMIGTHMFLSSMFSGSAGSKDAYTIAGAHKTAIPATARSTAVAISTVKSTTTGHANATHGAAQKTAATSTTPGATVHRPVVAMQTHRSSRRSKAHTAGRGGAHGPTSTATPIPSPTAASGIVSLANYWVGSQVARHGQTISVGYVIDNGTGRTLHLMLGASVKSARTLNWTQGTVSDPYHDVVAIVPPGTSTHVRFFTLPRQLQPGTYDVAWGLRDSTSGSREDLIAARSALHVAA